MKKLILTTVVVFFLLLSLQASYDEKEKAVEQTIDINEEIIETYEVRLKKDIFPDKISKYNYSNGYRGFLNWITNTEYKQLDEEFSKRIK